MLIPNAHEGYVSWEQHLQIQRAIAENVRGGEASGSVQGGAALLAGLLRCRRCGRKLTVLYMGNHHDVLRYVCLRGLLDSGEPPRLEPMWNQPFKWRDFDGCIRMKTNLLRGSPVAQW